MGQPRRQRNGATWPEEVDFNAEWQDYAVCGAFSESLSEYLFFNEDRRDPSKAERRAICFRCPVQQQCLEFGNKISPSYYAFGGFTAAERRVKLRYGEGKAPPGAEKAEMSV